MGCGVRKEHGISKAGYHFVQMRASSEEYPLLPKRRALKIQVG